MKKPPCIALLVFGCASTPTETPSGDSSTGVADTSTGPTTTTPTSEPSSGEPTTMDSMSLTGETETETDATDVTTSGPTGCQSSDECANPVAPICDDEVCVGCGAVGDGDPACGDKDPDAPVCADDGACVQCTEANTVLCGDTTPICDLAASVCVGCTYHEQCASGACRIATGACFDERDVFQVGEGQTYGTITEAVTVLGENLEAVLVLHGGPSFNEAVTLSGNGTAYAFIGADAEEPPQWVRTSGMGPTLTVEDGAEVYVQSVRFTGNGFPGAAAVTVDDGMLYLDRAEVVNNWGGDIALTNGAEATVRNCFVGGDRNDIAAVATTASTLDVIYSTIGAGFGDAAALRCDGPSTVRVSDSLLVARADSPELDCVADSLTSTVTEADVGDMNTNWFVGYGAGNLALNLANAPVEILTAAQWNNGDPLVDIDGDARPNVDGTADVAGADIP